MESRKESVKICIVPVSMSSLGFSCLGFLTGRKTEDIFFFGIWVIWGCKKKVGAGLRHVKSTRPLSFCYFSWSPTWSTHATCPSTPLRTSLACMTMLTSPRTRKKPSCSSTIFCSLRSVNCDFLVRSCVFLAVLKQEKDPGCPSNIPMCLLKRFAWPVVVCWDFLVRSCVFLTLSLKQEEDERLFQQPSLCAFWHLLLGCCGLLGLPCQKLCFLSCPWTGGRWRLSQQHPHVPFKTFCHLLLAHCGFVMLLYFRDSCCKINPYMKTLNPLRNKSVFVSDVFKTLLFCFS